jgi:FG-GAP-like repeat
MPHWPRLLGVAAALVVASSSVARAGYTVEMLHAVPGAPDSFYGIARLADGTDGYIYGVTHGGGSFSAGTFFRLKRDGSDFAVLFSFPSPSGPTWITRAHDGNFYVATQFGAYGVTGSGGGMGSIIRLTPGGTPTPLVNCGQNTCAWPLSVLEARDGNLYGLSEQGGDFRRGGVFRLTLDGTYTPVYDFQYPGPATDPVGYLSLGSDGNLYGDTWGFPLDTTISKAYQLTLSGVITPFTARGVFGVEAGADGAVYGTSLSSGACGGIHRMTLSTQVTLHIFDCATEGGIGPFNFAPPTSGTDGWLYGTTNTHVYRVATNGTFETLAPLPGGPSGPLMQASDGIFYGMTEGMIFRLTTTPPPPPAGFDADAAADLAFYDRATGTWRILTSSSGYQSSKQIFWGGAGYTPVPADYDGDGRLDVAVYHAATAGWWILTSSSNFTSVISHAWGGIGYVPVPGDVDGDHKADITVYRPATGQWYILQSRTDFTSAATVAFGGRGDVPVPGDYDGDGIADLALYSPATGAWRVRTSRSGFVTEIARTLGGPGYAPVPGDYDGDWRTDIAVYDQGTGDWSVLQSSGDFMTTWTLCWGGTGYTPVPGDYDGDGKNDLAVYDAARGEWFVLQSSSHFTTTLRTIFGDPTETVVTSVPVRLAWTDALRATDYDGDGVSDFAVYRPASGAWSILGSSGLFTSSRAVTFGGPGQTPVPGDYDGDGRTDIATFNDTSGLWSAKLSSGSMLTVILGGPGDVPLPRDYDGDLITDVAVYTPSTGVWRLRLSSSGFTTTTTVTWGGAGWIPVPGDFDGDGRADLGVYQSSTAEWRVLLASDFTTQLTMLWGGPGYTVAPGDYDGDGKIDFAACRNATGQWWVLKSGFAYTSAFGVPWGAAIDTPRSADYDGDGLADMASYDPATGNWKVRLSTSAFTLTLARTLGGPGFVVAGP